MPFLAQRKYMQQAPHTKTLDVLKTLHQKIKPHSRKTETAKIDTKVVTDWLDARKRLQEISDCISKHGSFLNSYKRKNPETQKLIEESTQLLKESLSPDYIPDQKLDQNLNSALKELEENCTSQKQKNSIDTIIKNPKQALTTDVADVTKLTLRDFLKATSKAKLLSLPGFGAQSFSEFNELIQNNFAFKIN